jgi:hypothetical protein
MRYSANGDRIHDDTAQAVYCRSCMRYLRPSGKRVPYESDEIIVWIPECDWCEEQRIERDAKDRRARKEEMMLRCEFAGCSEWFVPVRDWQRFCSPEHRWAAHRAKSRAAR